MVDIHDASLTYGQRCNELSNLMTQSRPSNALNTRTGGVLGKAFIRCRSDSARTRAQRRLLRIAKYMKKLRI